MRRVSVAAAISAAIVFVHVPAEARAQGFFESLFGSPALSSQDYLFAAGGSYPGGDRIYAYHERTVPNCSW